MLFASPADDAPLRVCGLLAEEFAEGHPPGALNLPVMLSEGGQMVPNPEFLAKLPSVLPDTSVSVLVGCKSGRRSMTAINHMAAKYRTLVNVGQGFTGWAGLGLPVEK